MLSTTSRCAGTPWLCLQTYLKALHMESSPEVSNGKCLIYAKQCKKLLHSDPPTYTERHRQYPAFQSWGNPHEKPSLSTVQIMMDDEASEAVVPLCSNGRAGSISHTDLSVQCDNMTQIYDVKPKNRVLAPSPTVITELFSGL